MSSSLHIIRSGVALGRSGAALTPAPAGDGGHIVAVAGNVLFVVDQLFVERLLDVGGRDRVAANGRSRPPPDGSGQCR